MIHSIKNKYLILDEESNAIDYLDKSLSFLKFVKNNKIYFKWFIISFHGAIYSFMLLALQKISSELIFASKRKKDKLHPIDRDLHSFLVTYKLLKETKNAQGKTFSATATHDACMNEINNKIRNQFIHFRPMVWAAEPWYFVEATYPLLDIIVYCTENANFRHSNKIVILSFVDGIKSLLNEIRAENK